MKKYVLCCVSPTKINLDFLKDITELLKKSSSQIESPHRYFEQDLISLDIEFEMVREPAELKESIVEISNQYQVDLALIPFEARHSRKLIVFDMDSTLIQQEVIDEMAKDFGIGNRVKEITEKAMNGLIDFDEALAERVSLLKGFSKQQMKNVLSRLQLTPGVEKLIFEVKKKGYKTAVISGGFQFFVDHFKENLKLDYAFANQLEWDGEVLTGKLKGKIINAVEKANLIEELSQIEKISLNQVVAVGDGANDLLMLAKAGFGIAFHAKDRVRKEAQYQLNHGPMTTLLYFLGIPGNHLTQKI